MVCTSAYLRERFKTFNSLCFDNRLPEPRLRVGTARKQLGSVRYKRQTSLFRTSRPADITLSISGFYDLPQQELDDTILHEMIHLYIIYNNVKDDSTHGHVFRAMADDLNRRFSRHITVSHKGELVPAGHGKTQNIIVITQLGDGTLCVTRPSLTRIRLFYRELPHVKGIVSAKWYNTSNPFFNAYPRALKLKFYKIEPLVLQRELAGAIPLQLTSRGFVRTE